MGLDTDPPSEGSRSSRETRESTSFGSVRTIRCPYLDCYRVDGDSVGSVAVREAPSSRSAVMKESIARILTFHSEAHDLNDRRLYRHGCTSSQRLFVSSYYAGARLYLSSNVGALVLATPDELAGYSCGLEK